MADRSPLGDAFGRQEPTNIPGVPGFYFNGFSSGVSNADTQLVLLLDNQPIAKLHMAYATAKTLHQFLSELIGTVEGATKMPMLSQADMDAALKAYMEKKVSTEK
jgi:hypothetical protein